ncbi:MAG: Asp-tRNA(Asn)/Glu-tRNA(Gln) amidotransferase subunit GatB [Bacteroidia bacterium]
MSNSIYDDYELVVGLEVHAQLNTQSKAFSSDSAAYGAAPNTQISPVSLGHPGTLPKFNERSLEFGVKLGLAMNCEIRRWNEFARKNYFYADLPKGYQITQHTTPLCHDGWLEIATDDGSKRRIGITRIHMEEDAGKSMHDQDPYDSLIDLNRCGVPLLEIVSEPDMRTPREAYNYLTEVRKLVRYLDICDGNMEEGSLRCDANISVRKKGASAFGTKVEVKNMNSIRNVQRAIEHEFKRQIDMLQAGETIYSETRSFDAVNGTTFALRSKEQANDYRYFPEPDLQPLVVEPAYIAGVRAQMPPLPTELFERFTSEYGLNEYDASVLTDTREVALYFNELTSLTNSYKQAANWVMGPVKSWLNAEAAHMDEFPLSSKQLAVLIQLVDEGTVSHSVAAQKLFPALMEQPHANPIDLARSMNLVQERNEDELRAQVEAVLAAWPDKVAEYKAGKKGVLGLFMGDVMKRTQGKADPKLTNQLLTEILSK